MGDELDLMAQSLAKPKTAGPQFAPDPLAELDIMAQDIGKQHELKKATKAKATEAITISPDDYAKALKLSTSGGVTPEAVLTDIKAFEDNAKTDYITSLAQTHPITSQWAVANRGNMILAQNDFKALAGLEDKFKAESDRVEFENLKRGRTGVWGALTGLAASLGSGGASLLAMPLDLARTVFSATLSPENASKAYDAARMVMPVQRLAQAAGDALDPYKRATQSALITDYSGEQHINWGAVNPLSLHGAENIANMVAGEAIPMAVQYAIGALLAPETGGASVAAVTAANAGKIAKVGKFAKAVWHYAKSPVSLVNAGRVVTGQAQEGVKEFMAQGMSEQDAWSKVAPGALLAGLFSAAAGSPLEAKFIEDMANKVAGAPGGLTFLSKVGKRLGSFATQGVKEGGQEVLEGIGEDLAAWITYNPDKTVKEFASNALMNFVGGAGMGGVMGASLHGSSAIKQSQQAAMFQALHDEKSRTKFLKDAPQAAADWVKTMTQNGNLEEVGIPVQQWDTYWQSVGEDPALKAEEIGITPQAYQEAVAHQGTTTDPVDLVVKTDAFFTNVMGTEHYNELGKDVRFKLGGDTQREAEAKAEVQQKQVDELMKSFVQDPESPIAKEVKAIQDQVTEQLTGKGSTVEEAQVQAELFAKQAAVLMARGNMTPEQFFSTYKLKVNDGQVFLSEKAAAAGGETLNQPSGGFKYVDVRTPEFKTWFGEDSNMTTPNGGPMQLYHGTSTEFTVFSESNKGAMGRGIYLGQAPEASEGYGNRLMPVFARGKYLDNYEWTDYISKFGYEQGRVEAMKDGWAGVRDDKFEDAVLVWDPKNIKSAMSNTGRFDSNNPSILFQPAGDRTGASLHTLGAERQDRVTGSRSTLSPEEKTVVQAGAKEHGFKAKDLEDQAREAKLRFPQADGWAKLVLNKIKADVAEDGTKKPILDWKVIPYSFDRIDGKSIKFGSPEYNKRIELLGRNMRDEVLAIFLRAQGGDEAAKKIVAQSGWYREMRTRLRHEFGGLGDFMADNLGALSPNTDVMWNWKNAIDIVKRATRGDFDAAIPAWAAHFDSITQKENELKAWFIEQQATGLTKKAIKDSAEYDQKYSEIADLKNGLRDIMPVKENGAKYVFNGVNAMKAVVDLWRVIKEEDPDIQRGSQAPKALNFSGNLIGFRERATIDVWAARMLNRLAGAERVPVPAESGVAGKMLPDGSTAGQFRAGQDAFTSAKDLIRAHDLMGKDAVLSKINDDDLQALVWFIEKEHWTKNNWTSAAGEGGSFELEANLAGTKNQQRVSELRSLINSTATSPDDKAKAQADLDALHRTMDRFTGGLSIQQSAGTQGQDFVPSDNAQAIVQQRLKNAIYSSDPDAIVMGSKVMSTQGRYMGEGERSIDLEVTSREGYDPTNLHLEMLKLAQENNQQSMFFSRVVRAEEAADPTRHRPGVEVYFKNKGSMADLQPLLDKLHKDMPFYTVIMNGRPTTETLAGSEGDVVGVRFQYMPEFMDDFDGLNGLTPDEIGSKMKAQAIVLGELAEKIAQENTEVTSALPLWYDSEVTFADKYQEKIDALTSGTTEGNDSGSGSQAWTGRSHSESLSDAVGFVGAASLAEGGNGEASGEPGVLLGGDAAQAQGLTLNQPEGTGGARGQIHILNNTFDLNTLHEANVSTAAHEFGHFYIEVLKDMASQEGASQQVKDDYATILKEYGENGVLTPQAHEKFADAHLLYLKEGVAPSLELQPAFSRYSTWLARIWSTVQSDMVANKTDGLVLTDEVRGVFNRLYATDQEIETVKYDMGKPMFATAEAAGMTQAQFDLYSKTEAKRISQAKEKLLKRLMVERERTLSKERRELYTQVYNRIKGEVESRPEYVALLRLVDDLKLSKQALLDRNIDLKKLGKDGIKTVYSVDSEMDPDTAATMLVGPDGRTPIYPSGDAMLQAIAGLESRIKVAERLADAEVAQSYPDSLTDPAALREAALESLNDSENAALVLAIELQALKRKQNQVKPFLNQQKAEQNRADKLKAEEAKVQQKLADAQTEAERKMVRDAWEAFKAEQKAEAEADKVKATEAAKAPDTRAFRQAAIQMLSQMRAYSLTPYRYLQAARKANQEAFKAMAKNDYEGAAKAKEREILNHFLYLESTKIQDQLDKFDAFDKKFDKASTREALGKASIRYTQNGLAGGTFLEQIDALRLRFGLSDFPGENMGKREETLAQWSQAQEFSEIDVAILDEAWKKSYQEMTVSEHQMLWNALKNIKTLAYAETRFLNKGKQVEYELAGLEISESIAKHNTMKRVLRKSEERTAKQNLIEKLQGFDSTFLKIEALISWMDGGQVSGPANRYLWQPLVDAQTLRYDMTVKIAQPLQEALRKMPDAQRKSMADPFTVAGMGTFSRGEIISMLFNMGNEENKRKLMEGYDWTPAQMAQAFSNLNAADLAFVQATWDTIETLWPAMVELEKRATGTEPKKVVASPFSIYNKDGDLIGDLQGGYWPLKADPDAPGHVPGLQAKADRLLEGSSARPSTSTSATKERTGATYPLLLDFQHILTSHINDVIMDLSHREALQSTYRLLKQKDVQGAIQEAFGVEYYKQFEPWLKTIAGDGSSAAAMGIGIWNKALMGARSNMIAAVLGFKFTSAFVQLADMTRVLGPGDYRVKPYHFGGAMLQMLKSPAETIAMVREMSGEMRHRPENLDRDIRETLNKMTGQQSLKDRYNRAAFKGLAFMDTFISIPSWLGAYQQSMKEHGNSEQAVQEADRTVRLKLMSGNPKDVVAVQRSNEFMKLVTMFMGDASSGYNMMRNAGHKAKGLGGFVTQFTPAAVLIMLGAIIGDLLKGQWPDEDEDKVTWTLRKASLAPFQTVPFLRDATRALDNKLAGKPFADYQFTPALSAVDKVIKGIDITVDMLGSEKEVDTLDWATKSGEAIGYAFGIGGTAQLSGATKYLRRVDSGEETPDNTAELVWNTVQGKPKKGVK